MRTRYDHRSPAVLALVVLVLETVGCGTSPLRKTKGPDASVGSNTDVRSDGGADPRPDYRKDEGADLVTMQTWDVYDSFKDLAEGSLDAKESSKDATVQDLSAIERKDVATEGAQDLSNDASEREDVAADNVQDGVERRDAATDRVQDGSALVEAGSKDASISDAVPRDAGGAVDTVPMLKLLAGGLGGAGTYDGTGSGARLCMPTGIASDGEGNLFVSDSPTNIIRKVVVSTGVVTTVAGAPEEAGIADGIGSEARFAFPSGLAIDGQGNLFIVDNQGHSIRKMVLATLAVTTLAGSIENPGSADGVGGAASFYSPWGIASDRAGNLYVTDQGNHTIRRIVVATGAVTTIAGSAGNFGATDGVGASSRFNSPRGIASDGAGNLYVADTGNDAVRKLVIATGEVTTVAREPFTSPAAVASDGKGTLFVVDNSDTTVRQIATSTGTVSLVAGEKYQGGYQDGTGPGARFLDPLGVVTDNAGNVFVADSANHSLRKVVAATGVVTTLAGQPYKSGTADGIRDGARFNQVQGLASDGQGNVFVADTANHTIRKIVLATGEVTTCAGSPRESGMTDGTGSNAQFADPRAIASDGMGNLFVADSYNNTVRKIVIATAAVTTIAGYPGTPGSSDGVGAAARFDLPYGVAVDTAGNLYVADEQNNTIRKVVVATGTVSTLAGSAGVAGSSDGVGAQARFSHPAALVWDELGNLFVGDSGNYTIRKLDVTSGAVTTLAGSAGNAGSADGKGTEALFSSLTGLAKDNAGNLFVSDTISYTVRKVTIDTGVVTTVVGANHHFGVLLGPLPASLGGPAGLALVAPATLLIADSENAVLQAEF